MPFMHGSISPTLYARRYVQIGDFKFETPLLLPSFSSKGVRSPVLKSVEYSKRFIDDTYLISLYDIENDLKGTDLDFADLIFIDSGGYEVSNFTDLQDRTGAKFQKQQWSVDQYMRGLKSCNHVTPSVFVSYDHPDERVDVEAQILRSKKHFDQCEISSGELLLKPNTKTSNYVDFKAASSLARDLESFCVIGVTEKEAGSSILKRMHNIADLRQSLNKKGIHTPIHIFGSLDPITSILYFLAGADIFDGLTWLRYAYQDDSAVYYQNWGALELSLDTGNDAVEGAMWERNYQYLKKMRLRMRRFLQDGDFEHLGRHHALFKNAYIDLMGA